MMDSNTMLGYDCLANYMLQNEVSEFASLQKIFAKSYFDSKEKISIEEWLVMEMQKQLPAVPRAEIQAMSNDIITSLKTTEEKNVSMKKSVKAGRSKESWLASCLLQSTSHMTVQESAKYLTGLDEALLEANAAIHETITTKAGLINQNRNLDGFLAEQYHVNSFNLKAQVTGSDAYAEVLKPSAGHTYAKNSVDIVIKDESGKILSRYQAKYGATAEETIRLIKRGDYRGQQLLVPEEQLETVQKAFPDRKVSSVISNGTVSSEPLKKGQAKKLQEDTQAGNWLDLDWSEYALKDIALGIGKQVGYASLLGASVGMGMNIMKKAVNDETLDVEELVGSAIDSGADFGIKAATAGALKVAAEKEIIRIIPKGTPGSTLANIAFIAVENVKVMKKVATGELTTKEGLEIMEQTTVACMAGIATSAKGTAVGASVGMIFGPIGAIVGGVAGGTIGYMAGSKVGENVVKGVQKIRKTAANYVKTITVEVKKRADELLRNVEQVWV